MEWSSVIENPLLRDLPDLYLARGAEEVWVVDEDLKVRFYGHGGRLDGSRRLPGVTSLND